MSRPAWVPITTNPFSNIFADELASHDWEVCDFSWTRAFLGRYDIWLEHWPETLFAERGGWLKSAMRRLATRISLHRARALVRVVHNESPHKALKPRDCRLMANLEKQTQGRIYMSPPVSEPVGRHVITRHPHFGAIYGRQDGRPANSQPVRVGLLGQVLPYKDPVKTVQALGGAAGIRLVIAGECSDKVLFETIEKEARSHENVELSLGRMSNSEFRDVLDSCTCVALPYRAMTNSGAALSALTRSVPVLAPVGFPAIRQLRHDVGALWVLEYEGDLRSNLDVLRDWAVMDRTGGHPDLSRYEPSLVGDEVDAFMSRLLRGAVR